MGGVDLLLPQPARPRHREVPHERQGCVSHDGGHVLSKSPPWWQASLQRLPNQIGKGLVQMIVITFLELQTYSSSLNKDFIHHIHLFVLFA